MIQEGLRKTLCKKLRADFSFVGFRVGSQPLPLTGVSRALRTRNAEKAYNLLGPLQGSFGPFGHEIPKKSKKGGLSALGSKKIEKKSKKVKNESNTTFFGFFFQPSFPHLFKTFFRISFTLL